MIISPELAVEEALQGISDHFRDKCYQSLQDKLQDKMLRCEAVDKQVLLSAFRKIYDNISFPDYDYSEFFDIKINRDDGSIAVEYFGPPLTYTYTFEVDTNER